MFKVDSLIKSDELFRYNFPLNCCFHYFSGILVTLVNRNGKFIVHYNVEVIGHLFSEMLQILHFIVPGLNSRFIIYDFLHAFKLI